MKNRSRQAARLFLVSSILLMTACDRGQAWINDLESGDYSKVQFGRAPGGMQPVVPDGDLEKQVALMREYFDAHPSLLNTIASQCPCIEPSPLEPFRQSAAWSDPLAGRTMVDFFAGYQEPRIFAGRRIQFLFTGDKQLDAIHIQDIPLEQ